MSILSGWAEQYGRMKRSHARLSEIAQGRLAASSDEARDALIHFFQDAYHLKDWIRNDDLVVAGDVEAHISETPQLSLCADLCNATKHLRLNRPRTGDTSTAFVGQDVTVHPATIGSGQAFSPALHGWRVQSAETILDALTLADDVVRAWERWLQQESLLATPVELT